jgi:NAD(P)-dependent dehydrogenase (short-subunit alcohol dehydrogenase family)
MVGGGSGIGLEICKLFVKQGAHVELLDINESSAQQAVADISNLHLDGSVFGSSCDVGNGEEVERVFVAIMSRCPRVDILVNNAGVACVGTVQQTSEADMDRQYRVNIKGVFYCTKFAVNSMMQDGKGGSIVNLASIASVIGLADRFAYSMSKGAVLTMTYSVATDYVKKGIRCNCVTPGRVHTPFVDGYLKKNFPGREAEMFDKLSAYQPIGRMGKPSEVASLVLYLASDEAAFITGSAYAVDGGVACRM